MRDVINLILLIVLYVVCDSARAILWLGQLAHVVYYASFLGLFTIGIYKVYKFVIYKIWLKDRRFIK